MPATELAKIDYTREQIELYKRTVAKGATDDELRLFLHDCKRRGIDPLDKLIYFTVRTDKRGNRTYTPITSIDYFRIRAEESGVYAGSDDPVFEWGDDPKFPISAKVTVWKIVAGVRCPFTATARWDEYHPDLSLPSSFMWVKMPCGQLGKCGEALSLRKGFPGQLQGLYAKEEMDQAGSEPKMAPEEAKAFVKQQMDALQEHTALPPANGPILQSEFEKKYGLPPHPANVAPIPAEIPHESQGNYVAYEDDMNGVGTGQARFTLTEVKEAKKKNGTPFRKVYWEGGWASCFDQELIDLFDNQIHKGDVVTAEIKKECGKGKWEKYVFTTITGIVETSRGTTIHPRLPVTYDEDPLFVTEGEGMPF